MIVATLTVILFTVGVFFYQQQNKDINDIQRQGVGLVRLLSSMSVEQLAGDKNVAGGLRLLQEGQVNQYFAYASVVNAQDGRSIVEFVTPGVIMPPIILSNQPSRWTGDRVFESTTGTTIYEYYAPIIEKGELKAFVRLGYMQPSYSLNTSQVRLLAMLALAIFLLTPLFYFMFKREIKPLTGIGTQLQTLIKKTESGESDIFNSSNTQDFMQKFSAVVEAAYVHIDALETKQTNSVVSSKLLMFQKDRLESALNALPCAILVADESGQITHASNNIHALLGTTDGQVLGSHLSDFSKDRELSEYLVKCRFNTNVQVNRLQEKDINLAGTGKRVVINPYPLYSPKKNQVLGSVIVFRDVTNDEMEQKQNGEFVAHVAHELKTPLNILYMYSETLLDNADISREITIEAANVIHDEVGRISQMIDNLLNLAMIEMGTVSIHRQRVKMTEFLQDIYESTSRNNKDGALDFNLVLPNNLGALSLDKDLVRVSINNLISNAIKYTDPGGKVELIAEENDTEIIIRVRDSGIGISEEDQQRIFNKFYRSEDDEVRQRTGHGLGLSLVQEAIKLHHGRITINSTPGQGSEFVISFTKESSMLQDAI